MPKSLVLLLLIVSLAPAMAQETEDEQMLDHEEQDRRYYERYLKPEKEEPAEKEQDPQQRPAPDADSAREAFIARAEELIRDRSYRVDGTAGYVVHTDDPRVRPEAVAELLDGFRGFFDEFWAGGTGLRLYDERSKVYVFYSFYKFNRALEGKWQRSTTRPKGHYRTDLDVLTLHSDAGPAPDLADDLVHEAAHQLIEQRFFYRGAMASPWVAEGLASYFGYTYMDSKGAFQPGEIGGKTVALMRDGKPDPSTQARQLLQDFKREVKSRKQEAFSLFSEVVATRDPARYYGADVVTRYTASWLLVHFLFHADEGRHRDGFFEYLTLEAEGRGGPEVFLATIGMTPGELETALLPYVKRLKSR